MLPSATHGSVKKLMWTMLGDGQLTKDGKGRYSPANPTGLPDPGNSGNPGNPANDSASVTTGLPQRPESGNPGDGHRYGENGGSVTPVTGVSGIRQNNEDKGAEPCLHGLPGGKDCYLCDPDHPFRQKNRPAHAGVGTEIEEEDL